MFDLATKIILVESSCRKSTGPRRGSVGYVSNISTSMMIPEHGIAVSLIEVFFYRYGFEQKTRIEKKTVLNVFPIVGQKGEGDIQHQVSTIMDKVRNDEFLTKSIRQLFETKESTHVIIAVPRSCNAPNMLSCSTNEFYAWGQAILSNVYIRAYVNESLTEGHFTNSKIDSMIDGNVWDRLLRMTMDREHRIAILRNWVSNSVIREKTAKILRILTIMAGRVYVRDTLAVVKANLAKTKFKSSKQYEMVVFNVFKHHLFKTYVTSDMHNYANKCPEKLLQHINTIEAVRAQLLVFSTNLGREEKVTT